MNRKRTSVKLRQGFKVMKWIHLAFSHFKCKIFANSNTYILNVQNFLFISLPFLDKN